MAEIPKIPDGSRMPEEEIRLATTGLIGKDRWLEAARVAEDQAYGKGYREGFAAGPSAAENPETWITCPACNGTGKMWGFGGQCKRCFGATVIKASSLNLEEAT